MRCRSAVDFLHFLMDEGNDSRVCDQSGVVLTGDADGFGTVAQMLEIGNDYGRCELLILSYDYAVLDKRRFLQLVLYDLRCDVLAEGKLEDLFLAVGNLEIFAVYQPAYVSGVEESF